VTDAPPPVPDGRADLVRNARVFGAWLVGSVVTIVAVILVVQLTVGGRSSPTADPARAATAAPASAAPTASTAPTAPDAPAPTTVGPSGPVATAAPAAPTPTSAVTTSTQPPGPVRIGFVNQEALVGSFPEVRTAAEQAVAYVNTALGGVHGRPVQLVVCTTDSTPARSQACAAELVRQGVVAVTLGVDYGSSALYGPLAAAGIPVVGGVPRVLEDYQATDAHFFVGGSVVTLPALAEFATQTLHAKKVAVVYRDVATFESVARTLVVQPVQAAGAQASVVTVANTSAPRPRIPSGTDAVVALADAGDCAPLAQAVRTAVPGVPILVPTSCGSVAGVGALGVAGPLYVPSELVDPTAPAPSFDPRLGADLDRYRQAMGAAATGGFAPIAFAAVVNLSRLAADADAPTADGIRARLAAPGARPGFLGHDDDCAQVHLAVAPAVCQTAALVYGVGTDATAAPAGWTDGSARVAAPARAS
jgi:branched-chain amino acid transport system substrate-binding protein